MKIIKPSVEEFIPQNPIQHIERCGRVCYKSEDKITDTSAEKFVSGIVKRGHLSVTEHYRFIVECDEVAYNYISRLQLKYLCLTRDFGKYLISGSARGLYEAYTDTHYTPARMVLIYCMNIITRDYPATKSLFPDIPELDADGFRTASIYELTDRERLIHGWHTLKFICDRGVTHELVRHRPCSFSQESTRYCNYNGDKFGNEITVIDPCFWDENDPQRKMWLRAMNSCETMYLDLIAEGATPQEARSVLPNSLKTELVITATNEEWLHLLKLRCSKAAHPQCREVCDMAKDILKADDPEIFGGL